MNTIDKVILVLEDEEPNMLLLEDGIFYPYPTSQEDMEIDLPSDLTGSGCRGISTLGELKAISRGTDDNTLALDITNFVLSTGMMPNLSEINTILTVKMLSNFEEFKPVGEFIPSVAPVKLSMVD